MTVEQYRKIRSFVLAKPYRIRLLRLFYTGLPALIYAIYPAALFLLAFRRDIRFWPVTLTPAATFFLVTAVRSWHNAPRPYEVTKLPPLIPKSTKGKSFPSRHCTCAAVIAVALWLAYPPAAVFCGAAAAVTALCRVIAGVHFPKDVIAGLAMGFVCGAAGIWIWNMLIV